MLHYALLTLHKKYLSNPYSFNAGSKDSTNFNDLTVKPQEFDVFEMRFLAIINKL